MISKTFGNLPSEKEFIDLVGDDGFKFGNDPFEGNETLSAKELWKSVNERVNGNDKEINWVSSILLVLGIEWV